MSKAQTYRAIEKQINDPRNRAKLDQLCRQQLRRHKATIFIKNASLAGLWTALITFVLVAGPSASQGLIALVLQIGDGAPGWHWFGVSVGILFAVALVPVGVLTLGLSLIRRSYRARLARML